MILPMWFHEFTGLLRARIALWRRSTFDSFEEDGVRTIHGRDFLEDDRFRRAYDRGLKAAGRDYAMRWRVHIGLWAADTASRLEGDFVECGVNRGFMSSAIMCYLDWDNLGKKFYLLDTFSGLAPGYMSETEVGEGALQRNAWRLKTGFYINGVDSVSENFSEWQNIVIVQGAIPETLSQIQCERVAFLHLDLNATVPEEAALRYLWGRLVPGAPVLLDDYGFKGHEEQRARMDEFASSKNITVGSLPTGQGLLVKS